MRYFSYVFFDVNKTFFIKGTFLLGAAAAFKVAIVF